MADVDEVVEFYSFGDHRVVERAAIDRGVGADLDVVANFDDAGLREFPVAAFALRVAEAVGADDGAGVDFDAVADANFFVERDARVDTAVGADLAIGGDGGVRADLRELADAGVFADHDVGADVRGWRDFRGCGDDGGRMNS